MTRLLLAILLCAPSWGAYAYKRTVTIDASKVGNSTQANFPVLIAGTYAYLATAANGGRLQNANGYDLDFFSDAALTVPLQWERVAHTLTDGRVEIWVKLPSLSHTANTVIYMAYGDAGVTTDQSDGAPVWSTAAAAWHLKDGSTLDLNDANGTLNLTNNNATAAAGKIGGGIGLSGSSQFASKSNCGYTLKPTTATGSAFTVSAWVYRSGNAAWNGFLGYHGMTNGYGFRFNNTSGKLLFHSRGTSLEYGTALSLSTWYHVAGVATTAGMKIYVNGVEVASNATDSQPQFIWDSGAFYLGKIQSDGVLFNGTIDEVRVSLTGRSADWILAEYNNQSSPATFYTVGSEATAAGRGRVVIATLRGNR